LIETLLLKAHAVLELPLLITQLAQTIFLVGSLLPKILQHQISNFEFNLLHQLLDFRIFFNLVQILKQMNLKLILLDLLKYLSTDASTQNVQIAKDITLISNKEFAFNANMDSNL